MNLRLVILAACVLAAAGAAAAQPATAQGLPAGLALARAEGRLVLADASGRPLYSVDFDRSGRDNRYRCYEECQQMWRPLKPAAGYRPTGDWSVVDRADGTAQVAYKGAPLYLFTGASLEAAAKLDVYPPAMSGYAAPPATIVDGVPRVARYWRHVPYAPPPPALDAPGEVTAVWRNETYVLADSAGRTLYVPNAAAACDGGCPGLEPFAAPILAAGVGSWTPVTDASGVRRWAYQGRPVFVATAEEPPGGDWEMLKAGS